MIQILAVSGSLRANSSNTAILRAIELLAPEDVQISLFAGLGALPHFNPELDSDIALADVNHWRTQLKEADGVLFCTPEYAHGVPGALKNALDWIVSSGEFMHKPTAVISASPSPDGGRQANASLVKTLRVMMADIGDEAILCLPGISAKLNASGEITDVATEHALKSLLNALVSAIQPGNSTSSRAS